MWVTVRLWHRRDRGERDHLYLSRVDSQPDGFYFQLQGQALCVDQVSMYRAGKEGGREAAW